MNIPSERRHPADFVGSVFSEVRIPDNIRHSRWWEKMRFVRWTRQAHESIRLHLRDTDVFSSVGTVRYTAADGSSRMLSFDGHNGKFSAIYDEGYRHGYEFGTAVLLAALARGTGAFYDVGANWGYFSLLIAARPGFSGPIISFETNPRVYADLEGLVRAAGLTSRIHPQNCGLGRTDENLNLAESDTFNTGVTRLESGGCGVSVPVRTLDSLCDLPEPDFIKLDAEGMELEILRGGEAMFSHARPHVCFENFLNYPRPSVTTAPLLWLQERDYRIFNPALCYRCGSQEVMASYGDPIEPLLSQDPHPRITLVEVTPANRFLLRTQLNLFACHSSRIGSLVDGGVISLASPASQLPA